ncbi:MAG TPA: hypothetical protein VG916_05850 [Gemmatimonadaceae bacterium]|nr:hypothetical protein [Gemmatimonadaceae bacterium]
MQQDQMFAGQSLRQAQQFLTVHAGAVPSANASAARKQLDTAIADFDQAVIAQGTITRAVRGEVQRRAGLERTLIRKYLTPLAKFARASLKGAPDYAALTPSATALVRERLVKTAQAMAVAAESHAADLRQAQFPADFLSQLKAAAAAVQASFDAGKAARVRRTGVTKEVRAALASGRQAIATLDALVCHTIVGNEPLEREWRAAKRVRRHGTGSGADAADAADGAAGAPAQGVAAAA